MASSGYIYTQALDDSSSARHGPFYITNVMEVAHSDLKVTASGKDRRDKKIPWKAESLDIENLRNKNE